MCKTTYIFIRKLSNINGTKEMVEILRLETHSSMIKNRLKFVVNPIYSPNSDP